MIIKNLTRKKTGIGQLLNYLFKYVTEEEKIKGFSGNDTLVIRHNVRSRSVQGFIKEFELNATNRTYRRIDETIVHHTILSWSHKDADKITNKMLLDIAKRYIELRGKNNLYIGAKHTDKAHIHLHLTMSGSQINGRSSRISKQEFATIKIEMDKFQKEQFPELEHSLPCHGWKQKNLNQKVSVGYSKGLKNQKDELIKELEGVYATSNSMAEFLEVIERLGLQPYYRTGILTGIRVRSNRKFRLVKLGFDSDKLNELDKSQKNRSNLLDELKLIRVKAKTNERELEREVTSSDSCSGEPQTMSCLRSNDQVFLKRGMGISP